METIESDFSHYRSEKANLARISLIKVGFYNEKVDDFNGRIAL